MSDQRKKIVLLDTHAILHRAYHALPDFASDKGEPTGALYGLTVLLLKLIKEFRPEIIVACYDLPKLTFRHAKFAEYKAGRAQVEDNLISQIRRSSQLFEAFGIPIVAAPGFEADDMLGTIVEKLKGNRSYQIIIASGDMDTLQLVTDDNVVVYTLKKGINDTIIYDEKGVKARFGFGPELLPDYKGLRGDPTDNIPGVKGIGEKTATELILKFGTIEKMYETLEKHKTQTVQKPNKTQNSKNKSSSKNQNEFGLSPRILDLLLANKEEAEFSKMLGTIRRDAPIDFSLELSNFKDNFKIETAKKFLGELSFRSLVPRLNEVATGEVKKPQMSTKPNHGSELSVDWAESPANAIDAVVRGETSDMPIVDVNSQQFKRSAIMYWLIDSSKTDPTGQQIFEYTKTNNLEDAENFLLKKIKIDKLEDVYKEIELPLIPILERVKEHGMLVDVGYLKELSDKYHIVLSQLEKDIWELAGGEFNINSPKQLGEIIFDKLGLGGKKVKKTATGNASTKVEELEKLKGTHPIIEKIMDYREYQKLLSTYIDSIPEQLGKDGRLHSDLIQTGAATGRMSSHNPNLQNIPIKTELGRVIRKAFVASLGFVLAAFDYSQIDLRMAALLSRDPLFIKIFQGKNDVHTSVASLVFKVAPEKVDREMRRRAKVINFGILYGMGVNALKQNLGTERKEAEEFYKMYFEQFHGLREYLDSLKEFARKNGYTTTFFGRRRYYPKIKSPMPFVRSMEERMAMNAPIQGTSADVIKLAMSKADEELKKAGIETKVFPLLQVHDELIYEIKKGVEKEATKIIIKAMESVLDGPVPLEVHASLGKDWGTLVGTNIVYCT
ncbi:MAG: hypothetical protein HZA95_03650 [Candidatus Vogelbacteria bacterium]|nr:hypothetical protein [Candidatus Vogelbacteria bacterium]